MSLITKGYETISAVVVFKFEGRGGGCTEAEAMGRLSTHMFDS
jgi:hypothetical protein